MDENQIFKDNIEINSKEKEIDESDNQKDLNDIDNLSNSKNKDSQNL